MKRKLNLPFVLFLCSAAVSVLSVAARIFLTLEFLEPEYGVYEQGTSLPLFYHIALAVIIAAFLAVAFIGRKSYSDNPVPAIGDLTTFTACISAFMLAASSLLSLYNILIAGASADLFSILLLVFSIPAIIFFVSLIRANVKPSAALVFMSFFTTAWSAAYLIMIYFDTSLLITSPGKTMNELALLAVMVYFLNESRFLLGTSSNTLFCAAASVAPVLLLTVSIPNLLFSDMLLIGDSDNFIFYAIECAFALFILSRLATFSRGKAAPDDMTGDDGGISTIKP